MSPLQASHIPYGVVWLCNGRIDIEHVAMLPWWSFQSPFGSIPDAVAMSSETFLCVALSLFPLSWIIYKESLVWFPYWGLRDVGHPRVVHVE